MKLIHPYKQNLIEAGVDEAGRGCLAGPVSAAAVILPPDYHHPLLNDSKQLSEASRNELREHIEAMAIDFAVAYADHQEIDRINIANASYLAMNRALRMLKKAPEFILVDGKYYKPDHQISYECFIKGDGRYKAIAAASILAKTYRDQIMKEYDLIYPDYLLAKNKGYPTPAHKNAVEKFGLTPIHRKTFGSFTQLSLDL